MPRNLETLKTTINKTVLAALRDIGQREDRSISALIDEALADLVAKYRSDHPRVKVMTAYQQSHKRFSQLYRKLAK